LSFAERWEERLRTIGEFGTLCDGWHGMLAEARGLSDIHNQLKVAAPAARLAFPSYSYFNYNYFFF
jgi:hypothetical protein